MQPHVTPTFPENINDYAPWVGQHGLLQPYGKCQCGCGNDTALALRTRKEVGWLEHHPKRFVHGHHAVLRPLPPLPKRPLEDRFWAGVAKGDPDECWEWKDGTTKSRGNLHNPGGSRLPYRFSYELHNGPIPEGMVVCHKCDNGHCCNPAHLFLGTQAENMDDMASKFRQPGRKLTKEQVICVRQRVAAGESQVEIAKELGVNKGTINGIIRHKTWKHI